MALRQGVRGKALTAYPLALLSWFAIWIGQTAATHLLIQTTTPMELRLDANYCGFVPAAFRRGPTA